MADAASNSVAPVLHVTLEKQHGELPLVVARLFEGGLVHLDDPLFATGTFTREREPHESACGLTRHENRL